MSLLKACRSGIASYVCLSILASGVASGQTKSNTCTADKLTAFEKCITTKAERFKVCIANAREKAHTLCHKGVSVKGFFDVTLAKESGYLCYSEAGDYCYSAPYWIPFLATGIGVLNDMGLKCREQRACLISGEASIFDKCVDQWMLGERIANVNLSAQFPLPKGVGVGVGVEFSRPSPGFAGFHNQCLDEQANELNACSLPDMCFKR